jgi:hypothetical protein
MISRSDSVKYIQHAVCVASLVVGVGIAAQPVVPMRTGGIILKPTVNAPVPSGPAVITKVEYKGRGADADTVILSILGTGDASQCQADIYNGPKLIPGKLLIGKFPKEYQYQTGITKNGGTETIKVIGSTGCAGGSPSVEVQGLPMGVITTVTTTIPNLAQPKQLLLTINGTGSATNCVVDITDGASTSYGKGIKLGAFGATHSVYHQLPENGLRVMAVKGCSGDAWTFPTAQPAPSAQ